MKALSLILLSLCCSANLLLSQKNNNMKNFGIVIHGGAGTILKENMTPELEKEYNDKMDIKKEGGNALFFI